MRRLAISVSTIGVRSPMLVTITVNCGAVGSEANKGRICAAEETGLPDLGSPICRTCGLPSRRSWIPLLARAERERPERTPGRRAPMHVHLQTEPGRKGDPSGRPRVRKWDCANRTLMALSPPRCKFNYPQPDPLRIPTALDPIMPGAPVQWLFDAEGECGHGQDGSGDGRLA